MVIAVDGGLAAVKSLNIRPDAIVGDFDTVKGELLKEYRSDRRHSLRAAPAGKG